FINKYDNGTAQPNLAATDLARFLVPLPPLDEQSRIVNKITELTLHTLTQENYQMMYVEYFELLIGIGLFHSLMVVDRQHKKPA
ncbi:restriction endonuclease subunit S, partial [Salmonella enterica subsp. enterica serovar Kentucky]|nr:restriction endonuclease subunit S [Salmonella enterica subsp. enterica serovar Kentucky]